MRYFGDLFGETANNTSKEEQVAIKRDDLTINKESIDKLKKLSDAAEKAGFTLTMFMSDDNTLYTLEGYTISINCGPYKSEDFLYVPDGAELASGVDSFAKGYIVKDQILKLQRKKTDMGDILTTTDVTEIEDKVAEISKAIMSLRNTLQSKG